MNDDYVDILQDGCDIIVQVINLNCSATIDAEMNIDFVCDGIVGDTCTAQASITDSWTLHCTDDCFFEFIKIDEDIPCERYSYYQCTEEDKRCGIVCNIEDPTPAALCVTYNPFYRSPAYYCDDLNDLSCDNGLCIDNFCGGICREDIECAAFVGTSCQPRMVACDNQNHTEFKFCTPTTAGETICRRTFDCETGKICSVHTYANSAATVCRTPQAGNALGQSCSQNSECASHLCVCNNQVCEGGAGVCSQICQGLGDCPYGARCEHLTVLDSSNVSHELTACTWPADSCENDAACTDGANIACRVQLDTLDLHNLYTVCGPKGTSAADYPLITTCDEDYDCFARLCLGHPKYCTHVCSSDADCQTVTAGICTIDSECDLGFQCDEPSTTCVRYTECRENIFRVGSELDSIPLCTFVRKPCTKNSDCRPGEVCNLYYNKTATDYYYGCEVAGPGSGTLGSSCTKPEDCQNNLCIEQPNGKICSQPCTNDNDCAPTSTYECGTTYIHYPVDSASIIPVCVRN
jgi:hypothetical protein